MIESPPFLAIAAVFFAAGMVKGITGMGLPTVAMGALGALISPLAAAALLVVPSLVTNLWQLLAGPSLLPLLARLWPMMTAIVLGTLMGTALLAEGGTGWTVSALGLALIAYAGYTLLARPYAVPAALEGRLSPLIGLATGAVTGATGIFVIPAVPYLQALGFAKDDLVQALGLSFTVSTVALAIGLGARGAFQIEHFWLSVLAVAPALAGMVLGQAVRDLVSPAVFRRWFLLALLLLGAELTSRVLF